MINLSWPQLLSGAFAIAVAMASASFTVGYSLRSGLIAELRLQLERVDQHNGQLHLALDQCKETCGDSELTGICADGFDVPEVSTRSNFVRAVGRFVRNGFVEWA